MLKQIGKNLLYIVPILIIGFILSGCQSQSKTAASPNKQISVVTTTNFYGEVAKQVLGNKGKVTSIINSSSVDPHDYEPTATTAKEVTKANVVIANGIGYDGWMDKLVKNSNKLDYIKVGEDIYHKKEGDNPHLWYKPETMPQLANLLAKKFGKMQPNNQKYFEQNAKKYIASLKPVQNVINDLKKVAKNSAKKNVYVSEPVFDYALESLGFKVADTAYEEAAENGTDPAPKVVKTMQEKIEQRQIAFFVFNKQVSSKNIKNLVELAKKNNVPVLPVTETPENNATYKEWMLKQYHELQKIIN
ncbi:metal ABC transporter substrate-binding protein [Pediococcus stilesii]|uniref:Metal ABC transporter substrate-binding protein n=1 Tax=Pediococcus stilesii TaxID=331679 RepID=A0A5R9BU70_9LACO|nr:metal ABC transporter solute-binding protein [Pediococcus stilesii]TLQ04155.1 metal ABC transporter substrate-binding protein [Pediococcus stilesii]